MQHFQYCMYCMSAFFLSSGFRAIHHIGCLRCISQLLALSAGRSEVCRFRRNVTIKYTTNTFRNSQTHQSCKKLEVIALHRLRFCEAERTTVQIATESDPCLLPEEATEAPAANRYRKEEKNTRGCTRNLREGI